MVKTRPHILKYTISEAEQPYQNENGDFIVPEPTIVEKEFICRAEPNGTGQLISGNDGQSILYSWIIFLNKTAERIGYGTKVFIYENDILIGQGTVKMFSKGQMNSRLWV